MQLEVHNLGLVDYQHSWQRMLEFTNQRDDHSPDQIWLVQHPPVFTQGQAGKAEHLLNPGSIAVVQSDRGGQVTYHGPGQVVIYPLINLRRLKLGVRELVTVLETSICQLLADYQVDAYAKANAPGVYVQRHGVEHKIASLGLRVRKGCSLHGLALNVAMDLAPFGCINPCGYEGLAMTQLIDCTPGEVAIDVDRVARQLCDCLVRNLGYNSAQLQYRDLERPAQS